MTLLSRINQTRELWSVMLPHVPPPDAAWIGRWCAHSDGIVEHAIIRTSKKFAVVSPMGEIPESIWRYASGVMNNEARRTNEGTETSGH